MSARTVASRKLEIGAFLQSWDPLKAKLRERLECEESEINRLTSNAVHGLSVEKLNEHILNKKAITMVFQMVEELKEDLHPDEVSSDAE